MKSASLHQIKKELQQKDSGELIELCLKLSKFKLEGKEYLSYLLFDADDEDEYVLLVKEYITSEFEAIPNKNVYYLKKSIRRILRKVKKHIRFSKIPTTELSLTLHYCNELLKFHDELRRSKQMRNVLEKQILSLDKILSKVHSDYKADFRTDIDDLRYRSKGII